MKVLLVNGSPHERGCTYTALKEASDAFNARGVESEIVWVGNGPVAGCTACGACRKTGKCVYDDHVNRIIEKLDAYDGFIFGTPVYYGGPSGQILGTMNRLFYSNARRMAHKCAAAVVSCRRGGATATFQQMNMHFMMTNMIVITSQYWNQVHGNLPEQTLQDGEGLQTMRVLAENMTYVMRCQEAGKAAGIPLPQYEPRITTSFHR